MGPCDTWMPSVWGFVTAVPGHSCTTPVLNPAPHTQAGSAKFWWMCIPPHPGLGPRPPEARLPRQGRGGGPACSYTASGKLTLAWVGHRHTLTSVLCARPSEAMAVQVSPGDRHQWPHTGHLKETDIEFLMVLEPEVPNRSISGPRSRGAPSCRFQLLGSRCPWADAPPRPPPTSVVALLTRAPGPG